MMLKNRESQPDKKRLRNYLISSEQHRLLVMILGAGFLVMLISFLGYEQNRAWLIGLAETTSAQKDKLVMDTSKTRMPGLDENQVAQIENDIHLRASEQGAWDNMMGLLLINTEEELEKYSVGRVMFAQLSQQPKSYHGELVKIVGTARRCTKEKARTTLQGVNHYFMVWILPDDCPDEPMAVECLKIPENFPQGEEINERITLTGFFFKRWTYVAGPEGDVVRTCPLLLAKTLKWIPKIKISATGSDMQPQFWCVLLLALVSSALILFFINRHTQKRKKDEEVLPERITMPIKENSDVFTVDSSVQLELPNEEENMSLWRDEEKKES